MNELLIYFIKVNVALALFYLLFRVFFHKDTFWKARRIYLLSAIAFSFLYPFIPVSQWFESPEAVPTFMYSLYNLPEFTVAPTATPAFTTEQVLGGLYMLVSTYLFLRILLQLTSIMRWRRKSRKDTLHGITVRILDENVVPFSFFKDIYLNPSLYQQDSELKEILTHEHTHASQWHSMDILLGELLCVVCWINPTAWLLRHEIRQNLEFLADNKVVQQGYNPKQYQYHLLNIALNIPDIQIVNNFNVSSLKKRIIMMNLRKTKKAGSIKYLLVLPLIAGLAIAGNAKNLSSEADQPQVAQEQTESPSDEVLFKVVEQMPEYPGGIEALFEYLSQNIKYPEEALKANEQGRVIVQFVVAKDGTIQNIRVVRSISPALDKEAIRVVSAMPRWTPGKQRGENVNVEYTLPVEFKLEGKEQAQPAQEQTSAPSDEVLFKVVEQMPEYPGGTDALFKYLAQNIKYPEEAVKANEQGRVIVQFVVAKDGTLQNIRVVRSISPALDKEAIRVVSAMPRWTPGKQRGKNVNVEYTMPIVFKFEGDNAPNTDDTSDIVVVGYGPQSNASKEGASAPTTKDTLSISSQNKPLIVKDGTVMESNFDLNSISPTDIDKIEVLKDESAMKVYGKKAKNGVIVITTLRNASQK